MRRNDDEEDDRGDGVGGGGGGGWEQWLRYGVAAASIAGGIYLATTAGPSRSEPQVTEEHTQISARKDESNKATSRSTWEIISGLFKMNLHNDKIVPEASIPLRPNITNLNALLADIYVRFIAIRKEDFDLHFRVFSVVLEKLHQNMKAVDKYYAKYATDMRFAGSHYDNLRIKKPDEFDMDIVISLPVNIRESSINPEESDIVIEQRFPAYVQLRAGTQYENILIRDGTDCIVNKVCHTWLDDRKYILRSKFTDWFKSVGYRALNMFPKQGSRPCVEVDGVWYSVRQSSSGPAWTVVIEAPHFRLDVDLVPALKFPESRWPVGRSYRPIPLGCSRGCWLVVPKPNKGGEGLHDEQRSWRLALHDQERKLMHDTNHLRQTIRLMKKFRDEQGMKKIASYYIKTLFFWEISQVDNSFWKQNNLTTLFKHMLLKFKIALDKGEIKYFWNGNYNLIGSVNHNILREYSVKVTKLLEAMESDYRSVAKFLLSPSEYDDYKKFL